ncbi:MAG: hypothetical protein RIT81_39720 [Deltaproteobacteria bacterium]
MNRTSALLAPLLFACSGAGTEPLDGLRDAGTTQAARDGGVRDGGPAPRDAGPRDAGPPPFLCVSDYPVASCDAQDALVRMIDTINTLPYLWTGDFRMEETGVYVGIYLDGEAPIGFLVDPEVVPEEATAVPEALARGRAVYHYDDPEGFLDDRTGSAYVYRISGEEVLMMRLTSEDLSAMRRGRYGLPGRMVREGFDIHQRATFEPLVGADRFLPWTAFPMTADILAHELLLMDALTDLDDAQTAPLRRELLESYVAVIDTIAQLDTTAEGDALYIIQETEHWSGSAAYIAYLAQERLARESFYEAFGGFQFTVDGELPALGLSGLEELLKRHMWILSGAAALYLTTALGENTYERLRAGASPYTMAAELTDLDDETRQQRLDALKVRYDYGEKLRIATDAMAR